MPTLDGQLVVAISSRALFALEDANSIFDAEGEAAYEAHQLARIDETAAPGVALPLVRKLLAFNTDSDKRVEVVLLSRNDPISGLRIFKSAESHGLPISRAAFLGGSDPYPYLEPLQAKLFLSANAEDVRRALELNVPAARVYARTTDSEQPFPDELRIAFDGDSVLFSDQAEQVYVKEKLQAFHAHEKRRANEPLPDGPLKPFLLALHGLQGNPPDGVTMRIRTALVTARDAPAHERALRTLVAWGVKVDQAFFLGGLEKTPFLRGFQPDFFFDDQLGHCNLASPHVSTGHVSYGIANEDEHA